MRVRCNYSRRDCYWVRVFFVIREEEVTGGSSDGEGLQAVSCGPKGIGESCSWDHTSTALGLDENGTQMKAWTPVQLQRLSAQNIYLQILIEADGQRLLTSQRLG